MLVFELLDLFDAMLAVDGSLVDVHLEQLISDLQVVHAEFFILHSVRKGCKIQLRIQMLKALQIFQAAGQLMLRHRPTVRVKRIDQHLLDLLLFDEVSLVSNLESRGVVKPAVHHETDLEINAGSCEQVLVNHVKIDVLFREILDVFVGEVLSQLCVWVVAFQLFEFFVGIDVGFQLHPDRFVDLAGRKQHVLHVQETPDHGRKYYYELSEQNGGDFFILIMQGSLKPNRTSLLYIWGDLDSLSSPTQVAIPGRLQQVSAGSAHYMVLADDRLFGFGQNNEGELGCDQNGIDELGRPILVQIKIPYIWKPIKQISCGDHHSLILDEAGQVYSSGSGSNGALGYGRGANSYEFKPVINDVFYISAGQDHSLALSKVKVYGWGSSKEGQLGLVKQLIYYQPQELFIFASYFCYAGGRYSVFGTEKGIYVTGFNQSGQLGLGHEKKVKMPKRVNLADKVVECLGCSTFILYKTEKEEYFISGRSSFGYYMYPTRIKSLKGAEMVGLSDRVGLKKDPDGSYYSWNPSSDSCFRAKQQLKEFGIQTLHSSAKRIIGTRFEPEQSKIRQGQGQQEQQQKQWKYGVVHHTNGGFLINSDREQNVAFSHISAVDHGAISTESRIKCNSPREEEVMTPLFTRTSPNQEDSYNHYQECSPAQMPAAGCSYEQLLAKVECLTRQNRQKDAYIKKMRSEFTDLLELVETDTSLRNIKNAQDPNYISRMRFQLDLAQPANAFETNMHTLRSILTACLKDSQ